MAVICPNCNSANTHPLADRYCCVFCGRTFIPGGPPDPEEPQFLAPSPLDQPQLSPSFLTTTESLGIVAGAEPEEEETPNFDAMTKAEIQAYADEEGIEGVDMDSQTKAEMIATLEETG